VSETRSVTRVFNDPLLSVRSVNRMLPWRRMATQPELAVAVTTRARSTGVRDAQPHEFLYGP